MEVNCQHTVIENRRAVLCGCFSFFRTGTPDGVQAGLELLTSQVVGLQAWNTMYASITTFLLQPKEIEVGSCFCRGAVSVCEGGEDLSRQMFRSSGH